MLMGTLAAFGYFRPTGVLLRAEAVDGCGLVGVLGAQQCAGERGLVGAVGVVLGLEAECTAPGVLYALLAHEAAVEEVAAIKRQGLRA